MEGVTGHLAKLLGTNVISEDDIRSCLGKAKCISGLMHVWMPFLSMDWAAIYNPEARGNSPVRRLWKSQVEVPLLWCRNCLKHELGEMSRTYTVQAYMQLCTTITITVEASPWAIGGYLTLDGVVQKFIFEQVGTEDLQ